MSLHQYDRKSDLISEGPPARQTRIPEFLLALTFAADGMAAPGLGIPMSYLGVIGLGLLGFARRPPVKLGRWSWVFFLLIGLLVYVSLVSMTGTPSFGASSWVRRLVRLGAIVLFMYQVATGRVHFASIVKGLAVGLLLNAALFFLRLAPDQYAGALTGYLFDKNRAGLFYSVVGLLILAAFKTTGGRILVALVFAALMWLTESRTSMTAYAAGLLWVFVLAKRPALVRGLGAFLLWLSVTYLESNFARAGVFENRWGSDLLRGRIDAAAAIKVAAAPWHGLGLGEAYVVVGRDTWYFHNSYDSLRVEGGWIYLIGVILIMVLVNLRPFAPGERDYERAVASGAAVVILVCAWKLGEVLLTITWALTVGGALYTVLRESGPGAVDPTAVDADDAVAVSRDGP